MKQDPDQLTAAILIIGIGTVIAIVLCYVLPILLVHR